MIQKLKLQNIFGDGIFATKPINGKILKICIFSLVDVREIELKVITAERETILEITEIMKGFNVFYPVNSVVSDYFYSCGECAVNLKNFKDGQGVQEITIFVEQS